MLRRVEYMSLEVYDLELGYNRVDDGKIVHGKDYHFGVAAYDQTWGAQGPDAWCVSPPQRRCGPRSRRRSRLS